MANLFDFCAIRQKLNQSLEASVQEDDLAALESVYNDVTGSEVEKKAAVEQAFRDQMKLAVKEGGDTKRIVLLVNLATSAVQHDLCATATLFILLQDQFDSITLDKCETLFTFVEERVSLWKSDMFYNAGKNYLLRMCNDLLRRLSKSQNTVFCGRIHLFLARLFPLHEKSGLNLMSQFNLDNTTQYNTKAEDNARNRKLSFDERDELMEVEEGEMNDVSSSIPIDYNLYRKFWSLQDFFRKPTNCYDKTAWKNFSSCTKDVLSCFESLKLDDVKLTRKKSDRKSDTEHTFFAKYLTSEKLLDLQLSDSNFRRYMLVQFLILFHYLSAKVKFKSSTQVLSEEQAAWIEETTAQVYTILRETPSDGAKFADTIEHMLQREENWNHWKNEGCASYVKEADSKPPPKRPKKRSLGEDLKASGGKLVKMGNHELTRLWNLCPDNMAACQQERRRFTPGMEEFFEEAIDQADPEAGIEEQYKLVNNTNFAWKSLRLLARFSPHFFAQQVSSGQGQSARQLPDYINMMTSKMTRDTAPTHDGVGGDDKIKSEETEKEDEKVGETELDEKADIEESNDDDQLGRSSAPASQAPPPETHQPSPATLRSLAGHVAKCWRTLGTELGFEEDDLAYFESENSDDESRANKMLTVWSESEGERATDSALYQALKEMGQLDIAVKVLGRIDDT